MRNITAIRVCRERSDYLLTALWAPSEIPKCWSCSSQHGSCVEDDEHSTCHYVGEPTLPSEHSVGRRHWLGAAFPPVGHFVDEREQFLVHVVRQRGQYLVPGGREIHPVHNALL